MPWISPRARWKYGGACVLMILSLIYLYHRGRSTSNGVETLPDRSPPPPAARGPPFHFDYGEYCDMLVNSGGWLGVPYVSCHEETRRVATCGNGHENNWQWASEAQQCGAQRLHPMDLRRMLQDRWLVIAGDSITRFFYGALLRLLANDDTQIVFGHQDFEYTLAGNIRASFLWAPYVSNITQLYDSWGGSRGPSPDVVVMSAGLWHMLHITDVLDFEDNLRALRDAAHSFTERLEEGKLAPPMTFFSMTEVFPPKLKTEEKRQRLTPINVDLYNRALLDSELLVPAGPFYLLDIHHLTQGCGAPCTHDGLHYNNETYDAAVQVWANNLHMLGNIKHL